eukprot:CAMPEP_0170491882 /NCGR_PEP_ID=MMETSP0208-20121228/11309_1 /TAXON_ID=197538 /ORGANISM="Strombidium inclinatum, Strain S3" /LENGTH=85 /DNA_ID=CAMNT_0010767527 /DNA_START=215 /DNA_END=472 /DNA_ORIENTATION=-
MTSLEILKRAESTDIESTVISRPVRITDDSTSNKASSSKSFGSNLKQKAAKEISSLLSMLRNKIQRNRHKEEVKNIKPKSRPPPP